MTEVFVIVLRDGFEAFLIVSVSVSYLQRTSRRQLLPSVAWLRERLQHAK
jgi:high-affinity Fe2+/Pb2+ permease